MELIQYSENTLIIKGDIKRESHYLEIKEQISALIASGQKELVLKIIHATTISSSVVGYLLKLVRRDRIAVSIEVSEEALLHLFYEFSLIRVLNVTLLER